MRGLDLYCGAGGCSVGYARAGFEMTGVDLFPKNYPFEFVRADALEFVRAHGHEYDFIHASPPCQAYSRTVHIWGREYPDTVAATRDALRATGRPYVIENVPEAPLIDYITLCGQMFGLRLFRHRKFESNVFLMSPPHPRHKGRAAEVGRQPLPNQVMTVAGHFANVAEARLCMGIDWMTRDELAQAIPPAYCQFIGEQLRQHLEGSAA